MSVGVREDLQLLGAVGESFAQLDLAHGRVFVSRMRVHDVFRQDPGFAEGFLAPRREQRLSHERVVDLGLVKAK